jgi:hypothetical protein
MAFLLDTTMTGASPEKGKEGEHFEPLGARGGGTARDGEAAA